MPIQRIPVRVLTQVPLIGDGLDLKVEKDSKWAGK